MDTNPKPKMCVPAIVVALHAIVVIVALQASTNLPRAGGIYLSCLVASLVLLVWWLRAKAIPLKERLGLLALGIGVLVWTGLMLRMPDPTPIVLSMSLLWVGCVLALLITQNRPWRTRRALVIGVLLAFAAIAPAFKITGITGAMLPTISWRWTPSPEEQLAASPEAMLDNLSGTAELPTGAGPADWPGFRGHARDGRLSGVTFATNWNGSPPKELWRQPIGLGWSSFTAISDYIFTQEQRGEDELVVCYVAETGKPVWVNRVSERFNDPQGTGPRATPTFDNRKLYVQGATGIVQCLDAATGKSLWKRDLKTNANPEIPTWGFASSPLIVDNLAIVFAGGPDGNSVVAYNKDSGELAWTGGEGTHSYSSGHLAQINGVSQMLMLSNVGIRALTPSTGEVLWRHEWPTQMFERCVQPVVSSDNVLMLGTADGEGTRQLVVEKGEAGWNVQEEWTTKKFKPYFNDSVYHKGYLYGYHGKRFICIDAATGERQWRGDMFGGQVLLLPDMNTLLILTEKGEVVLLEATPEGKREIARIKALEGKTWNHPVVAHGKLFVRNSQEAVCYQLPS